MKKKTRGHVALRSDLFISVYEGRDRIQELNTHLEEQAEEQASRPCQRAPACCSGCGTVSHKVWSCPTQ